MRKIVNLPPNPLEVDFPAALLSYVQLRTIVVNNERLAFHAVHYPDLEMLCSLPPPSCERLVVRGMYKQRNKGYFDVHVWKPLVSSKRNKKKFEYFPTEQQQLRESIFNLTTTSYQGTTESQLSASIRSVRLAL